MSDLVAWLRAQLDEDDSAAFRTIAWCRNGHDDDFANSLHIARWDPARVLAEVEAKRRILDMWEVADQHRYDLPSGISEGRDPDERDRDDAVAETFDDVVALLALPYTDRPGYDASWRP